MDTTQAFGSSGPRGRRYSVLIVEDEAAARELLKTAVNGAAVACQISEAATSEAALQAARAAAPDLVLLDIVLPGSGVLLCQQLCRDPRTRS